MNVINQIISKVQINNNNIRKTGVTIKYIACYMVKISFSGNLNCYDRNKMNNKLSNENYSNKTKSETI